MTAWVDRLRQRRALLEGHFRLSSGLHSERYVQCARLLQHPADAAAAGNDLARAVQSRIGGPPDAVISPAIGGIVLGHEVGRALGCRAIFAERDADGALRFRRGFELARGERVVAVEDVVTTGGSLGELIAVAEAAGAEVVAACALVDRSGGDLDRAVPWTALVELDVDVYDPAACPRCAAGEPAVKPGSRPESDAGGEQTDRFDVS